MTCRWTSVYHVILTIINMKPILSNSISPEGMFFVEHLRRGNVIGQYHIPNGVVNQGKNDILNSVFHNSTQRLYWWMGLIDSVGFSSISELDSYYGINLYAEGLTLPYWRFYWQYRKQITISNTNVGANDLADFPLCVRIINDADLRAATATGYDIRFTASDGVTLLNFEREYWSGGYGTNANAVFWVQVPLISNSSPTTIYMYYGNTNAIDGASINDTWTDDYKGVWHLPEVKTGTAGDYKDSTSNANNSTNTSSQPTRATGEISYGQFFDGTKNILIPNDSSLTVADLTLSMWVYPKSTADADFFAFDSGYVLEVGRQTDNKVGAYLYLNAGWRAFDFQYSINLLEWTYLVLVYDSSSGDLKLYVNGTLYDTINYAGSYPITHSTGTNNVIGAYTTSLYFTGTIDEVRVSSDIKTADQINFEWYNTTSVTNEITWGTEEPLTALPGNNWLEFIGYTDCGNTNTRPFWDNIESTEKLITNSSPVLFDLTEDCTINGIFLVGGMNAQIKGDSTVGVLWATAIPTNNIIGEVSDQIRVRYLVNV